VQYDAEVTGMGRVRLLPEGQEFPSPSRAAMVAAGVRAVDGWLAWHPEEFSVRELLSLWGAQGSRRSDQPHRSDLANHGLVVAPNATFDEALTKMLLNDFAVLNGPDAVAVRYGKELMGLSGRRSGSRRASGRSGIRHHLRETFSTFLAT
jgi:hypothetical protein